MPFTPFHMGPGLLIKAFLQGSFSLMVFGWTQIIMDIQPLIALLNRDENIHGFTHTYIGAVLIAIFSAVTGKHLSEFGLVVLRISRQHQPIKISWVVTLISAFIGSFSHVILDSLMHKDMRPFSPFSDTNILLDAVTVGDIYKYCTYSGLLGTVLYFSIRYWLQQKKITS